jgi:hypothetical protein
MSAAAFSCSWRDSREYIDSRQKETTVDSLHLVDQVTAALRAFIERAASS